MDNLPPIDPQAIIFIVVVIIGFLQSIFSKKKKKEQPYDDSGSFDPQAPERDDDPLREFRRMIEEAREQAQKSNPKRPKQQAKVVQKTAQEAPPAVIQRPTAQSEATVPAATIKATAAPTSTATTFPPAASKEPDTRKQSRNLSLKALLSSPSAARQAIILTEVLGPPKGLK